jgi:DNA ligase-1
MRLAQLVATSVRVAATASRTAKTSELAGFLRRLAPDEIELGVLFLSGETRQGRLGIGHAVIAGARPGSAAAEPQLMLADVDGALERIAHTSGKGAAPERARELSQLLARATREEQEFLARLLLGELRQGALEGMMSEAVARAATLPLADVQRAAMYAGALAPVARAALVEGASALSRFRVEPLRALRPMLAQPAEDVAAALRALGTAAFEWKLDGARMQAHKAADEVRVFTRNLNDVSAAVPEIVEAVRALPAAELILDGEAIALRADGSPQPFQVTMRRFGRKRDVETLRRSLPLSVLFFDCLRRDGEDLVEQRAARRFGALAEIAPPALVVPRLVTREPAEAEHFFAQALARGHEGVMAKSIDAPYEAGARGASWLKVKRAHTLDLVVLAAEWGHGRRRGWLSNLHLGARDPASGQFVMLGKTFKGLTDELLAWQTKELLAREIARDELTVYVKPELVVEIAFNDVQTSPQYPGGLALRFARVKGYRADKRASEADTIDAVRSIYAGRLARRAA